MNNHSLHSPDFIHLSVMALLPKFSCVTGSVSGSLSVPVVLFVSPAAVVLKVYIGKPNYLNSVFQKSWLFLCPPFHIL